MTPGVGLLLSLSKGWASLAESAGDSPEEPSRPAYCARCPGAGQTLWRPPEYSYPPPSPPGEPADILPPCTSVTPSKGSDTTLMDGGRRSNLQPPFVSDYPPARDNLPPPFTHPTAGYLRYRDFQHPASITTTLLRFGQFLAGNRFAKGKAARLSRAWAGRHKEVLKVLFLRSLVVILGRFSPCWLANTLLIQSLRQSRHGIMPLTERRFGCTELSAWSLSFLRRIALWPSRFEPQ